MIEKLASIEARYDQLTKDIADPAVQSDSAKFRSYSKELAEIQALVDRYREYKDVVAQIAATEELLKDPDMRELAQEELVLRPDGTIPLPTSPGLGVEVDWDVAGRYKVA